LAEAVAGLRAELSKARLESEGQDIRFDVDKVDIELTVDFGVEREAKGGLKVFSFIDLGAKVSDSKKTGHKVMLSLSIHPEGRPSEPFRISGKGPAPKLRSGDGR
jgi:hypothetical protein